MGGKESGKPDPMSLRLGGGGNLNDGFNTLISFSGGLVPVGPVTEVFTEERHPTGSLSL